MLNFFTKIPKPHAHQEIKTIGIIVGHTMKSPGAKITSDNGGESHEYHYNLTVANALLARKACDVVATRDYRGIQGATTKIIKAGVDLSIELHCNSANGKAHGVEALYYNSASFICCDFFCSELSKRFKRKNRGPKYVVANGRGITNLQLLQDLPYAIIAEPFFGDNKLDYISIQEYTNFMSEFLANVKLASTLWGGGKC